MTRAVLEGVAFTICDARSALMASGVSVDALALTGGGAKSGYWSQLIANAVGVPVTRFRDGDVGPALGVARLAAMAIPHEDAVTVFAKPQTLDIAEPLPGDREQSESRLARWRVTFKAVTDIGK
jgi:xylulokinase